MSFPGGSAGKESACNAGDLSSIPGLGRFPGEGNSYLLQYSGLENSMDCIVHGVVKSQIWLSDFHFLSYLVAQMVKHLPAMQETWVWSLGQEHPLEKEIATHSSILAWKISWTEEPGRLQSWGCRESDMTEWLTHAHLFTPPSNPDHANEHWHQQAADVAARWLITWKLLTCTQVVIFL